MRAYFKALWHLLWNKPLAYKCQFIQPVKFHYSAKEHLITKCIFHHPENSI